MVADLSNLEALLNIVVNATEIGGVGGGGGVLVTSFIPYASGLRGYSKKIALFSLGMIVTGLIAPGLATWIVTSAKNAGSEEVGLFVMLAVSGVVALVMLCASIAAYFLPAIIANREKKKNKLAILICNCFAFIPLVWLVSYIWACIPEKGPPVITE